VNCPKCNKEVQDWDCGWFECFNSECEIGHFDKYGKPSSEALNKQINPTPDLPSKITFPRHLIDDKLLIKALESVRQDCPTIRITHAYAQIFQEGLLKVAYDKQQKLKGLKHGFG